MVRSATRPWPWDSIAHHFNMPDLHTQPNITHAISYVARGNEIDRIVALDDYDVATAASLHETPSRRPSRKNWKASRFPERDTRSRNRAAMLRARPSRMS